MQAFPLWLIVGAAILGVIVGVSLTVLSTYLASHVRKRRTQFDLPPDLERTLEHLPVLAVIFDRSLRPVAMNHLASREPVKLEVLQETLWFPSYLRETAKSHGSLLRPSNENDPFWVHMFALADGRIVALIADEHKKYDTETLRREFITNASHELNTPVAAISLLAEAIDHAGGDPERIRSFSSSLVTEVDRLSALTRDIARLSEAQTGWEEETLRLVDLSEVACAVVENHRALAEGKHVDLSIGESDLSEPILVWGEERSLMVAVGNLVENAIQHSGPYTRVGVGISSAAGLARLAISDQGPGIPPDQQEKVFKRFYRVDADRSRKSGGTGLGLSIARNTARSLRGEVTLWSEVGIGSTFTMRLPLAKEDSHE